MKTPRNTRNSGRRTVAAMLAVAILAALAVGLTIAFNKLHDVWLEQCVINDIARQVTVTSGKMVKADAIKEAFGLHEGVNLARVDFAARREEALKKYPTIRSIDISRHLPDRVALTVIEREPTTRVNLVGKHQDSGLVADSEGVVFPCRRGTAMLPIIRESKAASTAVGQRLAGRSFAALKLVELCRNPEFSELGLLEVDVSKPDYLIAILGSYSQAKIAWEGMDDPEDPHLKELEAQLRHLSSAIRATSATSAKVWDVTLPNRVFSDNKGIN